jgi:Na+/melibiose symporter-like transporter
VNHLHYLKGNKIFKGEPARHHADHYTRGHSVIAIFLDWGGSYLLAQRVRHWLLWIPLAILLGILNSVINSFLVYFLGGYDEQETVAAIVRGAVLHTFICLLVTAYYRRRVRLRHSRRAF